MFKQVIRNTQLTTGAANNFFQHINGESFQYDVSFLSTLRALVAPRMKEGESIYLNFRHSNYSAVELSRHSIRNAIEGVIDLGDYDHGNIVIHNFCNTQDNNYAWMELMKSSFTNVYPGWHRLEKVTDFFKKTFYTLCFINPDDKSVVLFVDNMDIRRMHYLQCSIFAFLPWYFDPKVGVSETEMELIKSLRGKDYTKYEDCIATIAEQYDFRTARIRQLLAGFETRYEKVECENIRDKIQNCINLINDLNTKIGVYLGQKKEHEIRLLGLEAKIANGSEESEIMDYFLHNNNLALESVNNNRMVFTVRTYLEYFDEDLAERVINNNTSYIYQPNGRSCNNIIEADDMKMLMSAIFLEQKLRMRLCATYQFDLNGNVSALSSNGFGIEFRDCTPNTHIDRYHCIGNYVRVINELLKNHDYIGAIEQCSASCRSLNFNDSTVMCEFMRRIYGISDFQNSINIKCIELPDGTVVTPIDAIKWLKSQEVQ